MHGQQQQIVEIISDSMLEDDATLKRKLGEQGLAKACQIRETIESHLTENPAYAPLWQEFRNDPRLMKPALVGILEVISQTDLRLAQRLEALLAEYEEVVTAGQRAVTISTGGGAVIGGNVEVTRGDFVGRDSVRITGDGNVTGDYSRSVGRESPPSEDVDIEPSRLYQILETRFDKYDLSSLSFDLGVDFDDLPGSSKAEKARGLISHLQRRGRLRELVLVGQRLRPDIPWSEITKPKRGHRVT